MTDTATPPLSNPSPATVSGVVSRESGRAGSLAAIVVALFLIDVGVETVLAGSPVAWAVLGTGVVALAVLVLLWRRVGPTTRLAIPWFPLLALVAWVSLRLGSWADPGLRMATLTLPRLGVALAVVAMLTAVALLFGLRPMRRAWYVGLALGLVAIYALVPLVRALLAGSPLIQVLAGGLDWQRVPAWLQGGFLATHVVLPIGLVAGLAAIAASFARHARATWSVAGVAVILAALVVQSAELARAGKTSAAAALMAPVLARVSAVAAPDAATLAQLASAPAPGAVPVALPGAAPASASGSASDVSPASATPAPPGAVAVAQPGQPVVNKAIELRVTGERSASSVSGETAGAGREFIVVDMAWKNILEKVKVNRKKASDRTSGAGSLGFGGGTSAQDRADDEANTTTESIAFAVEPLSKHLWLVADGRFAEAVDVNATRAIPGHLGPEKIVIPNSQQVLSGGIAFQAPAGAQALSILFLDSSYGHLLIPIKGAPPVLAGSLGGGSRSNEFVDLALTGASFSNEPASEAGLRTYVLGLRGISRQNALVDVPFGEYGFLQTDQGCLVEPNTRATGLARQLAPMGRFLPFVPSEGQLSFEAPVNSTPIAFLLRLQQGGPIDMPLKAGAKPGWPTPEATIADGDVLRVLKLPGTAVPPEISLPQPGSERVALDLVVENLRSGAGIDLQANEQFRLVTPDGKRHEPIAESAKALCRLGRAVVPAGSARRFTLVYDVPPGQPLQFEYRGFNVKSELIKVR